ncbi:MAG: RluA family pseudouridine synthase [Lachnospiraceae bacterium]
MDKQRIIYEDKDIIVCHKPAGIATQTSKVGQRDMVSEVSNYLVSRQNQAKPYVGLVHRLDQPVEGILVFARNPKAAGELGRQMTANKMKKQYYAVIAAEDLRPEDIAVGVERTLIDYLYKDGRTNTSSVVEKEHQDAKRAELSYEIVEQQFETGLALVRIRLVTGRHHQIRVQMSHAGLSLVGDSKYADEKTKQLSKRLGIGQIALCAYQLSFEHPVTGKRMQFRITPEGRIFQTFSV